ncbi:plasmid partitioning family protein ParA [Acetobacter tropicalis NRIC 0312]|uniref:Cobyrinic acid a,c-diamide synthase n=2 Tax=Acetobacter tropicalis TaxID=104102 RepID=A0A511FRV5_9PROT|nr:ParA family protein [Acetobacter tropicalis]KXV54766.1 phosphopantetheine--protein transferase [Acetobacter tropicalis]GAL98878.1 phosphopantetheine-protein transferase [Acetobacter tropicalis]GBR70896.1 plasmid partitioning family protein ParA [Acetobacter tropicalis NRIC 0312]GEL51687.1 cobyrinic acid a,c-diamide synthase [Acetobacter tropicalis]
MKTGKIVVISKLKGGSGATTLTRELATAALDAGQPVAIIDLDAQGSLTNWWNRRTAANSAAGPKLIQLSPEKLPDMMEQLRGKFDLVLIDTPPSTHDALRKIASKADMAVIPTKPTPDDLDAVGPVIRQLRGVVPMAFVISQITSKRSPDVVEATELLSARAPVIGRTVIRVGYYRAAGVGQSGFETDKTVREEIATVYDNLMALLGDYHA